jgi:hypothetical protein
MFLIKLTNLQSDVVALSIEVLLITLPTLISCKHKQQIPFYSYGNDLITQPKHNDRMITKQVGTWK